MTIESQHPIPPQMSERDLQASVIQLARLLHLLTYHTHDSRHSAAGFPDLVIVGRSVLFVELKSASGLLTKAQAAWRDALRDTGAAWAEWRPRDWYSGDIRRALEDLMYRADGWAPPAELHPHQRRPR